MLNNDRINGYNLTQNTE